MPEIIITATAIGVFIIELATRGKDALYTMVAALGLVAAMAAAALSAGQTGTPEFINGMVATDGFAAFIKVLLAGVALLAVLMSKQYFAGQPASPRYGEYTALMMLTTVGMMVLATAADMVALFIGLETMSVGLYCLAGIRSERARSSESALKYLLLGAFASGFLLYGMALIYGGSGGQTNFAAIAGAVSGGWTVVTVAGVGLLLVGLLFKVAAAPFHFWSPDVYQGAPTPVTAFMSAGPKAAAMVVFVRLFGWALPEMSVAWGPALWVIAALTMTVGNVIAIAQTDVKRMLAYSSIAHAGYLLVGVLAASSAGVRSDAAAAMLFYLTAYYLMNLGAFTVAFLVNRAREDADYQISDYEGLASVHPWTALGLTVMLVSLAGIPPLAGFFGKLYLFSAAVKAGYVGLVVIAVLNSVLSVFYYLRLVVYMYMKPLARPVAVQMTWTTRAVVLVCVLGIVGFGLMPGGLMGKAKTDTATVVLPEGK